MELPGARGCGVASDICDIGEWIYILSQSVQLETVQPEIVGFDDCNHVVM